MSALAAPAEASAGTADVPDADFKLAVEFYKRENTTIASLPYDTKILLAALLKQARLGRCDPGKQEALGWFDWVGADRRSAWEELGDMEKRKAKARFCSMMRDSLPVFETWRLSELERIRQAAALAEEKRLARESAERERKERIRKFEEDRARLERERIDLLQQQHIAQVARDNGAPATAGPSTSADASCGAQGAERKMAISRTHPQQAAEFMKYLAQEQTPDSTITVERGSAMRVRVPNPRPGKTLLSWSFCTELHDIGFGLEFEVATEGNAETTVKTVIPIKRVDATKCVSSGQHCEPDSGFWCLIFDNTYSIFTPKSVHFLVETGTTVDN
mmetsp:Transcript_25796/g.67722  ORF Transcript_25796/g.67722 Transcript_25796/m.67722 type:complete len:333 (+) Transcript_25796:238-1236(+)